MSLNLPDPNKVVGDPNHTQDTNLIIEGINTLKSQVDNIPAGPQGPQGEPGTPGQNGLAATITVANTVTSAPGSNAAVTPSGTPQNVALTFTIPRGQTGPQGLTGTQGGIGPQGNPGPTGPKGIVKSATPPDNTGVLWADTSDTADSISVTVGTTTTGAAGSSASVVNSGNQFDAVLDFTIPQGIQGVQGIQGIQGAPGVVTATSPATYDAPTQTVGVDQTAIAIQPSQVAGTAVVDNDSRLMLAGGATGQVLTKVSGTNYDTAWQNVMGFNAAGREPGRWEGVPGPNSALTTTADLLIVSPIFFSQAVTLDRIAARVNTAGSSGSVVRLGIYGSTSTMFPGALALDAGTIDGTSATTQEINISITLPAGVYWIGAVSQGSPATHPILTGRSGNISPMFSDTSNPGQSSQGGLSQTGVTGALASTYAFGSGSANSQKPAIMVRIA